MRSLTLCLLLLSPAALAEEFQQDTRGIFLHGSYVLDTWGKGIPLQLGVQWAGIRSFNERKMLFTFDGAANAFGAYGGNSSERFFLLGGQLRVLGELGMRVQPENETSLYAGGTLAFSGSAVPVLGLPLDQYNQKNDLGGIAGIYGDVGLRLNGGVSHLSGDRALLVTAFVAEVARSPGSPASGPLYTDFGVRAQFDLVKSFTAALEGSWGTTFGRVDAAGVTNTATHWQITALVRKRLGPIWIALDGQLHGNTNTAVVKPNTYITATPSFASLGLALGVSL